MAYGKVVVYGSWDKNDAYIAESVTTAASAHFELEIGRWRDPFTLPQTKGPECVKVCEGPFGIKYCCEYAMQCQYMEVTGVLVVDVANFGDFLPAIKECHDIAAATGLVSAVVAAWLSGGAAAADAAVKSYVTTLTTCLEQKISEKILSVRVDFRSNWGGWQNCL